MGIRVPVHHHHLPPDRAPHLRRDVALEHLALRATAGAIREIDPELARGAGSGRMGDWVTVTTARAEIEARAMVTDACSQCASRGSVHVIGMPYHWGPSGLVTGDVVNDLIGVALDPNVAIHEAKVFTCNMRAGRRPRSRAAGRRPGRTTGPRGTAIDRSEGRRRRARAQARRGARGRPAEGDRASSPIRRSASAARRARWPASSGTSCRPTA